MAGASMNDIKSRMKSVQSTMQITKAMELVATSKLRRAKEKVERARPYYEVLGEAIKTIENSRDAGSSVWSAPQSGNKTLYITIAGDRGLAGGYNANIFRMTEALMQGSDALLLPLGKKAVEYYKHRNRRLLSDAYSEIAELCVSEAFEISELVCNAFAEGMIDRVILVYTKFVSMISQLPVYEELLPLAKEEGCDKCVTEPLIEEELEELLAQIVPNYIGGIIYSAICEASASESGARRSSMNAANKNAAEMIDTLMLKYNRARQAVITQEITEIVSGAEAL
jgi:F-type H+-transporting ATPase subunit gamma